MEIKTWIPATESKPPIGKVVIATLWNGTIATARWHGDRWQTPYRHSEDVVAWMEMEAYKEYMQNKENLILNLPVEIGGAVWDKNFPGQRFTVIGYRIGRITGEEEFEEDEEFRIEYARGGMGHYAKDSRMKMPKKWLKLFGGYENENEGVNYQKPDFLVSNKCCKYLKEDPCAKWAKAHNSHPFLGLMASEGGQREEALTERGCNYFGKTVIRSAPFAPFLRQDLLQLALDLKAPVPEIYGAIERKSDGTLYTTGAQRTGCSMCGFGIHLEKRPHRFDQLRKRNAKEWEFWMYNCCTDKNTGEKYGWGRVLNYIGVAWEDEYGE